MSIDVVDLLYESKEILPIEVDLTDDNGQPRDPTTIAVEVAFAPLGTAPSDWVAASWATDYSTDPDTFQAEILVSGTGGGGDVELDRGGYNVYLRLTDGSQEPVRRPFQVLVI